MLMKLNCLKIVKKIVRHFLKGHNLYFFSFWMPETGCFQNDIYYNQCRHGWPRPCLDFAEQKAVSGGTPLMLLPLHCGGLVCQKLALAVLIRDHWEPK